jgi:hypothetical protein
MTAPKKHTHLSHLCDAMLHGLFFGSMRYSARRQMLAIFAAMLSSALPPRRRKRNLSRPAK